MVSTDDEPISILLLVRQYGKSDPTVMASASQKNEVTNLESTGVQIVTRSNANPLS